MNFFAKLESFNESKINFLYPLEKGSTPFIYGSIFKITNECSVSK